jgi:hypothetical protein
VKGRSVPAAIAALVLVMGASVAAEAQDHTPQPYSPDEFQSWMRDSYRAEAIFVGSFPFTLFATLEAYDTVRYVSNGFNPSYAPWPLGSGTAVSYSAEETLWLAVSAVSLSMVISGVDYLIGRINERSSRH